MLNQIETKKGRRTVFRLSYMPKKDGDFFNELNLDDKAREEIMKLPKIQKSKDRMLELLDGPFRPNLKFRRQTRFSDSTFPVFYSALNEETARVEAGYWFKKYYRERPAFYQTFSCTFDGQEKDLRPLAHRWPDLVHDNDYSFCNRLGAEAKDLGIDGLITPCVRHESGANMPIFTRKSVSKPKLGTLISMTFHAESDEVVVASSPP